MNLLSVRSPVIKRRQRNSDAGSLPSVRKNASQAAMDMSDTASTFEEASLTEVTMFYKVYHISALTVVFKVSKRINYY